MISWRVTPTPLLGIIELAQVSADELDLVFDASTNALHVAPHSEIAWHDPSRGIPHPRVTASIQAFINERVDVEANGCGFGVAPQSPAIETYHLDGMTGRPGDDRIVMIAGGVGSGTQYEGPPLFQLRPWRLYHVSGSLRHRAPGGFTGLSGPDPARRRVHYAWHFNETLVARALAIEMRGATS